MPPIPPEGLTYPCTVPQGGPFRLCDYRTQGQDSRHFGAVPEETAWPVGRHAAAPPWIVGRKYGVSDTEVF